MQSTSIASLQIWYYPVPNFHFSHNFHLPCKITLNHRPRTQCTKHSLVALTAAHSCSKEREKNQDHYPRKIEPHPDQEIRDFYSSIESLKPHFVERTKESGFVTDRDLDVFSNMWWADLKAALGQRINVEGIACSFGILSKDKHLVIPHVCVPDIRYIDWGELKNRGFKGVVFDKDNTITVPYSLSLWAPLESTIEQCKSLFGNNIAVFSNSAGLHEYDPDGRKARALEDAIGIKVIKHRAKKPAGTAEEIERHFGCDSSQLIMVGDRPFTDLVFGNRNGFLTILTEPLSLAEEPLIVRQVRLLEVALVNQWCKKGLKPVSHRLFPDSVKCVKDSPL